MKKLAVSAALAALFLAVLPGPAFAESASGASGFIDFEGGSAFTGYNDLQIPADTGTRLSLADDIRSNPALALRFRLGYTVAGRHTLVLLAAPLTVRGEGTLDRAVTYYGATFAAGSRVRSEYRFDSYRLTYRYAFVKNDALTLAAGITGKIRSAGITLMDDSASATRTDLGVVPLVNVWAEWRFAGPYSVLLDADALVTPYGRAEDALVALQYRLSDRAKARIGYRILEGGSDGGGEVYTFSLFHYVTAGITVAF